MVGLAVPRWTAGLGTRLGITVGNSVHRSCEVVEGIRPQGVNGVWRTPAQSGFSCWSAAFPRRGQVSARVGGELGKNVDAEPQGRTQVVHDSYPQVVDSVDGRVTSVMMRRTAADEPPGPWKARLFWGSTCGRDLGTPCCDEVEDVCDGYQQPVDNCPQRYSPSLPAPGGNEQPPYLWVRGPVLEAMPEDGPAGVMGPYAATAVTTEAMKIHR